MSRLSKRPAFAALAVAGLALSACASAGTAPRDGSYSQRLDALMQDCQARGGILSPIAGAQSGSPERDHVCEIRGLPSSRTR